MAWNQPGRNGDRDPWGDRGSQQGPPDLDEVLRKLQAQLGRIFGGGPRIPGGGLPGGSRGVGVVAILLLGAWVLSGIYIVNEGEQAVVLRFGKFHGTSEAGPHWLPRFIDSREIVNVQLVRNADIGFRRTGGGTTSVPNEALMLTQDENIIDIKFAVQYRVKDAPEYLFNVVDPDLTLRQATESAVRETVGKSQMDPVLTTERDLVAARADELIQEILDRYRAGLLIVSVNMQDAQPPQEVKAAFDDAVKAREDEERLKNEARAYAADILPKARGEATAVLERARAYRQRVVAAAEGETDRFLKVLTEYRKAPGVTRERLYLDAIEAVMANTSKVMIDLQGGNNIVYLPLDKLLDQRRSSPSESYGGYTGDFSRLSEGEESSERDRITSRNQSR